MDANAAVIVLLMCTGTSADCMEIASERTFETASACRSALPGMVARMNRDGRSVTGRCAPAADYRIPAWVDPIVTCTVAVPDATATVQVTRMGEGSPVTEERVVPKADRRPCG
jgi:hypothetical protein